MKKTIVLSALLSLTCAASAQSESHWGVMGGVNLSTNSAKDFKAKPGAYIGGFYDLHLTGNLYLQPQLLLSAEMYETKKSAAATADYETYNISVPVLLSEKFVLSPSSALRVNVGPYVQYAFCGRAATGITRNGTEMLSKKEWWHGSIGDRLSVGAKVGLDYEIGHMKVSAAYQYPFRKSYVYGTGHEQTWQLGIGYRF